MKKFIVQLIRDPKLYQYIFVGGFSALVDIGLFLWLRQHLIYHYLILATLSFLIATLVNYLLCNYLVFTHAQHHPSSKRLALTYAVSTIGLCIHHFCLFLAFEWLALPLVISKLFAMGIAFNWNFLSRKHLVFSAA